MLATKDPRKIAARFWQKVDRSGECWVWLSGVNNQGYGRFRDPLAYGKQKRIFAHRFSWQMANGLIPDGMLVLHKCDNRKCVRPDHLFLGNHRDNAVDAISKGRHQSQTNPDCYLRGDALRAVRPYTPRPPAQRGPKITRAQAIEIRLSKDHVKVLCDRYGLDQSTVYKIRKGAMWRSSST